MSGGKEWNAVEVGKLAEIFPVMPTRDVAAILGRSVTAVSVKAAKLGLKKSFPAGIVWTEEQLKLLRKFFPTMFNRDLAKLLGVSQRTMSRKAAELGLEKTETFFEDRRDDMRLRESKRLKQMYAEGKLSSTFRKGVSSNPDGQFKPGHVESPETKAKRSESLKRSWERRKLAQRMRKVYGIEI